MVRVARVSGDNKAPAPGDTDEICHHLYVWPAIKSLLPPGKLSILDAGCGRGRIAALLCGLGHHVVGIDSSAADLTVARTRNPGVRFEALSVYDDLTAVRPAGGFDIIVAAEVIEHLSSPLRFLVNMRENLKPTGAIILSTPYHGYFKNLLLSLTNSWDRHFSVGWEGGHVKFFSKRSLSAMLAEAGLGRPVFLNAGRLPLLWKSMVCRAASITAYAPLRKGEEV